MEGILGSSIVRSGLLYLVILFLLWLFNRKDPEAREREHAEVMGMFWWTLAIVVVLMLLGKVPFLIPVAVAIVVFVLAKIVLRARQNIRRW